MEFSTLKRFLYFYQCNRFHLEQFVGFYTFVLLFLLLILQLEHLSLLFVTGPLVPQLCILFFSFLFIFKCRYNEDLYHSLVYGLRFLQVLRGITSIHDKEPF